MTGVIGFLAVRNYGLGFAAGGLGAAVWLWASSLLELGDAPASIAIGNSGASTTTPHMVTTVGIAAALVMLVVGAALSFASRHRP